MEMPKKALKPGAAAKFIASIFMVFEYYWLSTNLPNPYANQESAFLFFYFYFFILLFVGPFLMFDGIRYLKARSQLLALDWIFFVIEALALFAILYMLSVIAGFI